MRWTWRFTTAGNASRCHGEGTDRAAFDAWDVATQRRLGWRAGLTFWAKTNTNGRILISRHWPHKLCWDWSLAWEPYRGRERDGERTIGLVYGYGSCTVHLAICRFRYSWQDYGDEWTEASEGVFQNRRCSRVFKDAAGSAYDINGKVFVEPNGVGFTSSDSRVPVTFPYVPATEYVNVPADR